MNLLYENRIKELERENSHLKELVNNLLVFFFILFTFKVKIGINFWRKI